MVVGEERHPLLYRPLVEFMLAVPWEHFVQPGRDRIVQRRATAGLLPDLIRNRRSKASGTAMLQRSMGEHWEAVRPLTLGRRLGALGLVDPPAFRQACERMRHGVLNKQLRYLAAGLSLEMWLRANEEDRSPAREVPSPAARPLAGV